MRTFQRWVGCLAAVALLALPGALSAQDASGTWALELSAPEGSASVVLTLEVDGTTVTGTTSADEPFSGTFEDGELEISGPLYVGQAGYSATLEISGTVDGDRITGSGDWDGYALAVTGRRRG